MGDDAADVQPGGARVQLGPCPRPADRLCPRLVQRRLGLVDRKLGPIDLVGTGDDQPVEDRAGAADVAEAHRDAVGRLIAGDDGRLIVGVAILRAEPDLRGGDVARRDASLFQRGEHARHPVCLIGERDGGGRCLRHHAGADRRHVGHARHPALGADVQRRAVDVGWRGLALRHGRCRDEDQRQDDNAHSTVLFVEHGFG